MIRNITTSVVALIVVILLGIALYQSCRLKRELNSLQTDYDSLYLAKTISDTVIRRDTMWLKQDTAFITKAITKEVLVVDSFYISQPLMDRTYEDVLSSEGAEVRYKALVRGWLLEIELFPVIEIKHIHTQHIVKESVATWGRGYSVGIGAVMPLGYYASLGYRANRITYRGTYFRIRNENMGAIGVEYNF